MSAMPVLTAIEEQASRSTLGTVWQVDHQVRSGGEGDIDLFSNSRQASDDWLPIDAERRLNLRWVQTVWLTFGTISNPDYRATLTGFDGSRVQIAGEPVVLLQDELLKRVPRR